MSDTIMDQQPPMGECPSCGATYEVRWMDARTGEPMLPTCGRCGVRMVLSQRQFQKVWHEERQGLSHHSWATWEPVT